MKDSPTDPETRPQEHAALVALVAKARPQHYAGECPWCGMDEKPGDSCPFLKYLAEFDAAIAALSAPASPGAGAAQPVATCLIGGGHQWTPDTDGYCKHCRPAPAAVPEPGYTREAFEHDRRGQGWGPEGEPEPPASPADASNCSLEENCPCSACLRERRMIGPDGALKLTRYGRAIYEAGRKAAGASERRVTREHVRALHQFGLHWTADGEPCDLGTGPFVLLRDVLRLFDGETP